MPEPRARPNNNDELDDDDEDGSKGEDEEVVAFDEYRDLPPSTKLKNSPVKPQPSYASQGRSSNKRLQSVVSNEDLDSQESLSHVVFVTSIPWPAAAGKRPPRDMKRLIAGEWYIVCKVMKWGDTPALFVRATHDYNGDYGFYKPPAQFYSYQFQVGDRLQLSQVGYSSSRNKVATNIKVKPTHMAQVPESKLHWVAPPAQEVAPPMDPKPKKKSPEAAGFNDSFHNGQKRKKQKEEPIMMATHRQNFTDSPMIQSFSPLVLGQQQGKKTQLYPMFQHHQSFGPGTGGLGGTQLMSGGNLFAFPSTADLGLPRVQSLSFMSDLMATSSSGNLMAPQSPIINPASPLMGVPQPGMHRIPSIGGTFGGLGSFSMNSPGAQLAMSYAFPSHANLNIGGEQPN